MQVSTEFAKIRIPTITDDGKLIVGDVFLETTINNIKANDGRIAVSVYDAQNLEGYPGIIQTVCIRL